MIPKFRAWDKKNKEMGDVRTIDFDEEMINNYTSYIGKNPAILFEQIVLMQSTGLKDKNGVEIFEGDIVEISRNFFNVVDYQIKDGCWRLKPVDTRWACSYFSNYEDKSEWIVTGNIYENKELLGVGNE